MSDIREAIRAMPDKTVCIGTSVKGYDVKALLDRLEKLEGAAKRALTSRIISNSDFVTEAFDGLREALK